MSGGMMADDLERVCCLLDSLHVEVSVVGADAVRVGEELVGREVLVTGLVVRPVVRVESVRRPVTALQLSQLHRRHRGHFGDAEVGGARVLEDDVADVREQKGVLGQRLVELVGDVALHLPRLQQLEHLNVKA